MQGPGEETGCERGEQPEQRELGRGREPGRVEQRGCAAGTLTRCGRYRGRGWGRCTVSGATMSASAPASIRISDTRYGSRNGATAYWASSPASSGPSPRPPRLAAAAVISARAGVCPGRAAACSSLRYAVTVAVSMPTLMPEITRPAIRPGTDGQARNAAPESMLTTSAISAIRLRPSQSETWPTRNRLAMTPIA